MNNQKLNFSEAVIARSRELSITPKLLLLAIGGIADNEKIPVKTILLKYAQELASDMQDAAQRQIVKGGARSKFSGLEAMKPLDLAMFSNDDFVDDKMPNMERLTADGEVLRNLHGVAWVTTLKEHDSIVKRFYSKDDSSDFVSIIGRLCFDLIKDCKKLSHFFTEDMNSN